MYMYAYDSFHSMAFPSSSDGKASTCNAGDLGSIPSWGTKIQYAAWCDQKIKTFLNNCILSHILMSNVNPDYCKTF